MVRNLRSERAKQGLWGTPVLIVLIGGLLLAGIVWFGVEWYGSAISPEAPLSQQAEEYQQGGGN